MILLISASWEAGIIGINHQGPAWKCSWTRQRWWLHTLVNVLNSTEL
jgi:hypothetical protein